MILLCLMGAAAAIRRMVALALPVRNGPPQLVALDAAFAQKPVLTLLHIVPALVLVSLVPFQFSRSFRNRHLQIHRWIGRTIMVLGLIIGFSALVLLRDPIGGGVEVSAILVFDAIFLAFPRRLEIQVFRQSRVVSKQLADRDLLFPILGELRQISRHRIV